MNIAKPGAAVLALWALAGCAMHQAHHPASAAPSTAMQGDCGAQAQRVPGESRMQCGSMMRGCMSPMTPNMDRATAAMAQRCQ